MPRCRSCALHPTAQCPNPRRSDLWTCLSPWLAVPKVWVEQRLLLHGIGFGSKRIPPSLQRNAIGCDYPGPSRHDAGAVVDEQVLQGRELAPRSGRSREERGAGVGQAFRPPIVVQRDRAERRELVGSVSLRQCPVSDPCLGGQARIGAAKRHDDAHGLLHALEDARWHLRVMPFRRAVDDPDRERTPAHPGSLTLCVTQGPPSGGAGGALSSAAGESSYPACSPHISPGSSCHRTCTTGPAARSSTATTPSRGRCSRDLRSARAPCKTRACALVPAGVWSLGAALHLAARSEQAEVLHAGTDFAGRWSADAGLIAGWRYAVIVEAEECPPRLAGTVDVGWFATSRVDTVLRSCRGRWNTLEQP